MTMTMTLTFLDIHLLLLKLLLLLLLVMMLLMLLMLLGRRWLLLLMLLLLLLSWGDPRRVLSKDGGEGQQCQCETGQQHPCGQWWSW